MVTARDGELVHFMRISQFTNSVASKVESVNSPIQWPLTTNQSIQWKKVRITNSVSAILFLISAWWGAVVGNFLHACRHLVRGLDTTREVHGMACELLADFAALWERSFCARKASRVWLGMCSRSATRVIYLIRFTGSRVLQTWHVSSSALAKSDILCNEELAFQGVCTQSVSQDTVQETSIWKEPLDRAWWRSHDEVFLRSSRKDGELGWLHLPPFKNIGFKWYQFLFLRGVLLELLIDGRFSSLKNPNQSLQNPNQSPIHLPIFPNQSIQHSLGWKCESVNSPIHQRFWKTRISQVSLGFNSPSLLATHFNSSPHKQFSSVQFSSIFDRFVVFCKLD